MSRRILHIIDSLARTGTARQLLLLSQGLARDGWDVHVAALRGAGLRRATDLSKDFAAAGIPVTKLGRRFVVDPLADVLLARHVARLRPDVVHTWNTVPGLFGPLVNRKHGAPRIIAGQYCIDRSAPSWESFIHRRFARHVDRFVANSPTVRAGCLANGLPADKFAIVSSGVPPAPTSDVARDELLRQLELPPNAKLVGVVGSLVPEKRVKALIWAADLLRVLHDNLRVLIIGNGPQRDVLHRYARLASDLDHIQFLGERDDIWRIMPHLDVLWNASENTGPSIATLEAFAAGVPVIASDTPSNRELVIENESGYLIPLGTRAGRAARATDRLFTDSGLAKCLSDAARIRVAESFNGEQMVRQYVALYDARAI